MELPKRIGKKCGRLFMRVKGVTNDINIKSEIHNAIENKNVEDAIYRSWSVDENDINRSVSESTVTLDGTKDSWYQKEEAGRIA